jgi:hypothetical protein
MGGSSSGASPTRDGIDDAVPVLWAMAAGRVAGLDDLCVDASSGLLGGNSNVFLKYRVASSWCVFALLTSACGGGAPLTPTSTPPADQIESGPFKAEVTSFTPPSGSTLSFGSKFEVVYKVHQGSEPSGWYRDVVTFVRDDGAYFFPDICGAHGLAEMGGLVLSGSFEGFLLPNEGIHQFGARHTINVAVLFARIANPDTPPACLPLVDRTRTVFPEKADLYRLDIPVNWRVPQ